jgi:hypothetical protein
LQEKIDKVLQEVDWRMFDNSTVIFVLRGIKFSFFEYGFPLVKSTIREESLGVDIASDEDISAMKLLAIAKRGVKKDFYDLWFLMKKRGWDLKDVIGFAKFKYPNIDAGIYLRSIVYFKDTEKETAQKEVEMVWEQIKEFFEFQCKSLLKDMNLLQKVASVNDFSVFQKKERFFHLVPYSLLVFQKVKQGFWFSVSPQHVLPLFTVVKNDLYG